MRYSQEPRRQLNLPAAEAQKNSLSLVINKIHVFIYPRLASDEFLPKKIKDSWYQRFSHMRRTSYRNEAVIFFPASPSKTWSVSKEKSLLSRIKKLGFRGIVLERKKLNEINLPKLEKLFALRDLTLKPTGLIVHSMKGDESAEQAFEKIRCALKKLKAGLKITNISYSKT